VDDAQATSAFRRPERGWWISLSGDFRKDDLPYRLAYDAAFRLRAEAPLFDEARSVLPTGTGRLPRSRRSAPATIAAGLIGRDRAGASEGQRREANGSLTTWFLVCILAGRV